MVGSLGGVFRLSVHGLGLRFSGWLVRGASHTGHCTPDGMSLVSCTGYAVLTLMRVVFCRPGSSRPGGNAPTPGHRSEGLPRCDYRGEGALVSNPGPQANPLTEVVREVLTSSRTATASCTPCAGASAGDMHWLGYCASFMLSFLPTRTARSKKIIKKDSDVVTDGTVGWRRRNTSLILHRFFCHFQFSS